MSKDAAAEYEVRQVLSEGAVWVDCDLLELNSDKRHLSVKIRGDNKSLKVKFEEVRKPPPAGDDFNPKVLLQSISVHS